MEQYGDYLDNLKREMEAEKRAAAALRERHTPQELKQQKTELQKRAKGYQREVQKKVKQLEEGRAELMGLAMKRRDLEAQLKAKGGKDRDISVQLGIAKHHRERLLSGLPQLEASIQRDEEKRKQAERELRGVKKALE